MKTAKLRQKKFIDESTVVQEDKAYWQQYCLYKAHQYAQMICPDQVLRTASLNTEPPSKSFHKAMRCVCLLMKAMTPLHKGLRAIKDHETFEKWSNIR